MKVLVVDDEPSIVNALKINLELEGFRVCACTESEQALEEMKSQFFDIVITDIRMPGIDGVKLITELKKLHPICQIIVITGFSNLNYLIETLEKGVIDYFTKPFDMQLLIETMNLLKTKIARWKKTCVIGKKS
jgi:YesN/AraC family two-component response regulator